MKRRRILQWLGLSSLPLLRTSPGRANAKTAGYDVLVVGAGVFGVWTAASLRSAGKKVAVIDAYGIAHSGSSSGGESRVTRCGYGDNELYTEWACRSQADWLALSEQAALPLFHRIGVLWIHQRDDEFVAQTLANLQRRSIPARLLSAGELRSRYPVLSVSDDEAGFIEPDSGGLMARRAVQTLADVLADDGVKFLRDRVRPVRRDSGVAGSLPFVLTENGQRIDAEQFVFACGPWLDRVCPEAMAGRLFVSRQEVFFFAAGSERTGALPVWADLPFYGLPDLEGRGFKVADDTRGAAVDPDTAVRNPSADREAAAREFLARRFPSLAAAPLRESRVCQYENTANGDFVIDRHPGFDNVWLAGGGSGHGFKHGPAIGTHVAGLVAGIQRPIPRFSLASKSATRE